MTFTDAHDADTGHVLLDTETFEHAMAELLSPGPLSLSPLLDVDGVDDRFGLRGDFPSPNAGSAARASEELSGGGAVSKMSDDSRALGDSRSDKENPAARGKKRRVNTNQAEVQKRYRERKKSKLEDLERTVAELREQVRSLRSKSRSGSDSPPASDPESDSAGKGLSSRDSDHDVVTLGAPHAHYELSFPARSPSPPRDSAGFDGGALGAEERHHSESLRIRESGALMRDVAAAAIKSVAASNGRAPKLLHSCFAKALETGEVLRDGPGNEKKAPVSFRSFTEVELFYANQEKVYDLSVEKLKGLVRVGASDDVVRAAVLDIVNVVGDARRERPDVAFFTTQQAEIQMIDDDCTVNPEAPDDRSWFTKGCGTSCAYMVKSVVDRKLMKGDWPRIVRSVCEALPPKDVTAICDWGTEFLTSRRDVLLSRMATISKYSNVNVGDSSSSDPRLFGWSAADLNANRDAKDDMYKELFEGLQEEFRLHHEGTVKLFSTLPPRSAAAIIILTHPVALDTFSLATELKRARKVKPRNMKWLLGEDFPVPVPPEDGEAPTA